MRPNFYVLEYFHHKLATVVAPPTDVTATWLSPISITATRHDTTRLVGNFPVTSPRTRWRRRQLVGDKLATCYGQVANLWTTGAVGVHTRHVTLIAVIH